MNSIGTVVSNQLEIVAILQDIALERLRRSPPAPSSEQLAEINLAVEFLNSTSLIDAKELREDNDLLLYLLNRLLTKLGVAPMSALDQQTLDRIKAAEAKIDDLKGVADKLAEALAKLEEERSSHTTDVAEVLDKLNEVIGHVEAVTPVPTPVPPAPTPPAPLPPSSDLDEDQPSMVG